MFKSMKKKTTIGIMFLWLSGLVLVLTGSSSAQQAGSYQNANFADGGVFLFSKINFGENRYDFWKPGSDFSGFGGIGMQNNVKLIFKSSADVDVEIKASDDAKTYKYLGTIKANGGGTIYAKANQLIIAKVAGKDKAIPFGRRRLTDESEQAFSIQKVNNSDGYGLYPAPRRKQ